MDFYIYIIENKMINTANIAYNGQCVLGSLLRKPPKTAVVKHFPLAANETYQDKIKTGSNFNI
jgi:hypothetical protein